MGCVTRCGQGCSKGAPSSRSDTYQGTSHYNVSSWFSSFLDATRAGTVRTLMHHDTHTHTRARTPTSSAPWPSWVKSLWMMTLRTS